MTRFLALAILLPAFVLPVPGQSFDTAAAASRARLKEIVETGNTPAASAAVVVDGRTVWKEAAGLATIQPQAAATPGTRFGLGSISKTLTMAAAVRLWERGVLDLDAPVEKYLPDFPHAGRGITVRRLAAHQSGMADAFERAHRETRDHYATVDAAYQRIKAERLEFEPGTRTEYRTATYTVIARVMEAAAGKPYLEIMRDEVFAPLGLDSIVPNDPRTPPRDLAGFYMTRAGGGFVAGPYFDPSFKLAGAGFVATAEDVARFGAALASGPYLSDRARAEMFRPVALSNGTVTEWALGIRGGAFEGRRMLHIPGGGIGISAWLHIYPDAKMATAVLTNVPTGAAGGRTHAIIAGQFLGALNK